MRQCGGLACKVSRSAVSNVMDPLRSIAAVFAGNCSFQKCTRTPTCTQSQFHSSLYAHISTHHVRVTEDVGHGRDSPARALPSMAIASLISEARTCAKSSTVRAGLRSNHQQSEQVSAPSGQAPPPINSYTSGSMLANCARKHCWLCRTKTLCAGATVLTVN